MKIKANIEQIDRVLNIALSPFSGVDFLEKDLYEYNIDERMGKLYKSLIRKISIDKLDEIDRIFKFFYEDNLDNSYEHYLKILKNFSEEFISHRDGKLTFKYWIKENNKYFKEYSGIEKAMIWNSLNRYLPTDILGILYYHSNIKESNKNIEESINMEPHEILQGYYSKITLEDWQLEGVLKKGIGETHLHFSSATNFYNSWKNLMNIYLRDNEVLTRANLLLEDRGEEIYHLRLLGIYLRIEMAKVVFQDLEDLKELEEVFKLNDEALKESIIEDFEKTFYKNYREEDSIEFLRKTGVDLLEYYYNSSDEIETFMENILLYSIVDKIEAKDTLKKDDEEEIEKIKILEKYFIGYLRIKNYFFRIMVQGNQIKGLENFKEYFNRGTSYGGEPGNGWIKEKFRAQFRDQNLKKLEIRISPNENYSQMVRYLKNILEAYREILESSSGNDYPQIGIIYHFIKDKDKNTHWDEEKRSGRCIKEYYSCDYEKYNHLAFGILQKKYKDETSNILKLRRSIDNLSKYIVGIDGANIENYTDPWVFSQIFEKIRNSDNGFFNYNKKKIETLGFSYHAGEDFNHILSGLRKIDECIKSFKYHAGDRIGHGIALGVSVELWVKSHPVVMISRIEYIENLLWLWGRGKNIYADLGYDMGYLERKIFEEVKNIYGIMEGITIYNLWEMYCSKFKKLDINPITEKIIKSASGCNCDKIKKSKFESEDYKDILCLDGEKIWTSDLLKCSYHCEKYLYKMEEIIEIRVTKEEIEFYEKIQRQLRKEIASQGVIVETNPTSNVAIGDILNIFNHYIFNLNNVDGISKDDEDYLMVSINSDNPIIFNTSLSNEFAYIYYSLIEEGYQKEVVLKWIDKIRQYGMDSSFIRDRTDSKREIIEELKEIIEKLAE